MLPMVTIIAINLGYVVAGAITAEVVFNWPGLGTLTVDALASPRLPGPPGGLHAAVDHRRHREPHGRRRLRLPRSAGAAVSTTDTTGPSATTVRRSVRAEQWRLRGRSAALVPESIRRRRDGVIGAVILVDVRGPRPGPGPVRRAPADRDDRHRRAARSAVGGPHLRDRRARAGHAQPDGPRGPDLDVDRPPGDADHGLRRGLDRRSSRGSSAAGPTAS